MDSLSDNGNIINIDVRANEFSKETQEAILEIVTRNYLRQQNIAYRKIPSDCKCSSANASLVVGKVIGTVEESLPDSPNKQKSVIAESPSRA